VAKDKGSVLGTHLHAATYPKEHIAVGGSSCHASAQLHKETAEQLLLMRALNKAERLFATVATTESIALAALLYAIMAEEGSSTAQLAFAHLLKIHGSWLQRVFVVDTTPQPAPPRAAPSPPSPSHPLDWVRTGGPSYERLKLLTSRAEGRTVVSVNTSSVGGERLRLRYLLKAADQHMADAYLEIGDFLFDGLAGIQSDYLLAYEYYRISSSERPQLESAISRLRMPPEAAARHDNDPTLSDDNGALKMIQVEGGVRAQSLFNMGVMTMCGFGVETNQEHARDYFQRATDQFSPSWLAGRVAVWAANATVWAQERQLATRLQGVMRSWNEWASHDLHVDASTVVDMLDVCWHAGNATLDTIRHAGHPSPLESKLHDIFNTFDVDRSGAIDKLEYFEALQALGVTMMPEKALAIFLKEGTAGEEALDFEAFGRAYLKMIPGDGATSPTVVTDAAAKLADATHNWKERKEKTQGFFSKEKRQGFSKKSTTADGGAVLEIGTSALRFGKRLEETNMPSDVDIGVLRMPPLRGGLKQGQHQYASFATLPRFGLEAWVYVDHFPVGGARLVSQHGVFDLRVVQTRVMVQPRVGNPFDDGPTEPRLEKGGVYLEARDLIGNVQVMGKIRLRRGEWFHAAVVKGRESYRMYVNGLLDVEVAVAADPAAACPADDDGNTANANAAAPRRVIEPLTIGGLLITDAKDRFASAAHRYEETVSGIVREVRVWNEPRSQVRKDGRKERVEG
jgi:TPR repeat protein